MRCRPLVVLAAGIAPAALAAPAYGFPDGVPWESAKGEVCSACHFDRPVVEGSDALVLDGLPATIEPGGRYSLTVRLEDADMRRAGFLLSIMRGTEEAGRLIATDSRVDTRGARARSTGAGSALSGSGASVWTVTWEAPDTVPRPVAFRVWSVAANGDGSPLGDRVHELTVEIRRAVEAGGGPD